MNTISRIWPNDAAGRVPYWVYSDPDVYAAELERAIEARRYEPRHFPHYNLGRAYLGKEMYGQAMRCFQEALQVEPRYSAARQALESLRRMVN